MGGINAEILNKLRSCSWRETGLFALNCRRLRWFSFLPLANFKSANAAARCCSGKVSEIPLITNTHVRHHITPTPGARAHVPKTRDKKKKTKRKKYVVYQHLAPAAFFARRQIWYLDTIFDLQQVLTSSGLKCRQVTRARPRGRLVEALWRARYGTGTFTFTPRF